MAVDAARGATEKLKFDEAKSILYGTISAAGAALEMASRRRESTVASVASYLDRIQLDISGLSVIHVTGTKGKGSTCAMVESVLRKHGYRTGLYTSPHLLEVTERIRRDGKPLSKETFAGYFFEVWDRLQSTATATAEMPTYFHLLTLVGLWCFVQEGVDVCVLEVGMGGRYDATNVVPSPVACGVAMLDLDHTQVLGDTLDKIAWEKGGIFKEGCHAMTVEQPRGGMSVLRECAKSAGCGELEVVEPLPTLDPSGRAYEIGLAGEHQRVNAGLALRLCAVWMETRKKQAQILQRQQQKQQQGRAPHFGAIGDTDAFRRSAEVHKGLSECAWPGRCQVFRTPAFPSVTVYLDGAHTEQSMHACLKWFVDKTARAAETKGKDDDGALPLTADSATTVEAAALPPVDRRPRPRTQPALQVRRSRRILWFNASHERDVFPLLDKLASARRPAPLSKSDGYGGDEDENDKWPLFDEAWFMELNPGRPSRFAIPSAEEILAHHGVSPAAADAVVGRIMDGAAAAVGDVQPSPVGRCLPGMSEGPAEASTCPGSAGAESGEYQNAAGGRREGEKEKEAGVEARAGAWQRTLQEVFTCLQARRGGRLSTTLTGKASEFMRKLGLICTNGQNKAAATEPVDRGTHRSGGTSALTADSDHKNEWEAVEAGQPGKGSSGDVVVEILCTGSLYAVAAALESFGAQVG